MFRLLHWYKFLDPDDLYPILFEKLGSLNLATVVEMETEAKLVLLIS